MSTSVNELETLQSVYMAWKISTELRGGDENHPPAEVYVARRGGYEAVAEDATLLRNAIVEWTKGGGLTGEAS